MQRYGVFSTSSILPNSASPQQNPQAASVFGSHEFSIHPSIELLPNGKTAVAFVPDSSTIFREDTRLNVSTLPNGMKFIPWGADDMMPYNIISKIKMMKRSPPRVKHHSRTGNRPAGDFMVQWAARS